MNAVAQDPTALWSANTTRDRAGVLRVAGVPVTELAREFGTPAYLFDEADFRARCMWFSEVFAGFDVYYAGKAFLCRAVAKVVAASGLRLDVCSAGELAVARAAGFPVSRLVVHGNNKSADELAEAVRLGVGRIVVDSAEEIEALSALAARLDRPVSILVRVTAGVHTDAHDHNATGHEDQKFGFTRSDGAADAAIRRVREDSRLDLVGLHTHIGSQIREPDGFEEALRVLLELRARTGGQPVAELSLGGGFGIAHTAAETALDVADLARRLRAVVEEEVRSGGLPAPRLAIEPGRAIVGPAGSTVYRVGVVRRRPGGLTYVAVDGGLSDNIRPALLGAEYTVVLANRDSAAALVPVRVVGKHCDAGDIIVRNGTLPGDVRAGDLLIVPRTGAYCRSFASNFNHTPRPPVVGVHDGGARVLVRRETVDDLLRLDLG